MGFWSFMLVMDLLTPLIMIGFGKYFLKNPPKEINKVFGYRTAMSMKNKDTWTFAHRHFGKVWYLCGLAVLLASVIVMGMVIGKPENTVALAGGILCCVQMFFLIGGIIPTEIAPHRLFDKNGNRRKDSKSKTVNQP